jgi:hypothetical protein
MLKKETLFFLVALLLLAVVVTDIYWWIQVSSDYSKTLAQVKEEYLQKLPAFLASGNRVVWFNVVLLLAATFLFYKSSARAALRLPGRILAIATAAIGLWQLFTLS